MSEQVLFKIWALCFKIASEEEANGVEVWRGADKSKDLFEGSLRPLDKDEEIESPFEGLEFAWIIGEFAKWSM